MILHNAYINLLSSNAVSVGGCGRFLGDGHAAPYRCVHFLCDVNIDLVFCQEILCI